MDFKILLIESKNKVQKEQNWHLVDNNTVKYYYNLDQPILIYGEVFSDCDCP